MKVLSGQKLIKAPTTYLGSLCRNYIV